MTGTILIIAGIVVIDVVTFWCLLKNSSDIDDMEGYVQ